MQSLIDLLSNRRRNVNLDVAALEVAMIEYPEITPDPFVEILDSYAVELSEKLTPHADAEEFIEIAGGYMFDELGFCGNQEDYYNPRNSCLNEVVTARVGNPISLAVVYIEIARRLARPVHGIALPGHFFVKYDDGDFRAYVDVFHGGRIVNERECFDLASSIVSAPVNDPTYLAPVENHQIVVRILNNLRAIYLRNRDYVKAFEVLSLLLEATPNSGDCFLQRGVVNIELRKFDQAKSDLQRYLTLEPTALDRGAVEQQIRVIDQWLSKRKVSEKYS